MTQEQARTPVPPIIETNQRETREFLIPNFGTGAFIVHEGKGRKDHADLIGIHTTGVFNIDGYGPGGAKAAQILAEELTVALNEISIYPDSNHQAIIQKAQTIAATRMSQAEAADRAAGLLKEDQKWGGVCYMLFLPSFEEVFQAGDVKLASLDASWQKKDATRDQHNPSLKSEVSNFVSPKRTGEATSTPLKSLQIGDWIIIASDALWENLSLEDNTDKQIEILRSIVQGAQTPAEVAARLDTHVAKQMEGELGRIAEYEQLKSEHIEGTFPKPPPKVGKLDNFSIIVIRVDQKTSG